MGTGILLRRRRDCRSGGGRLPAAAVRIAAGDEDRLGNRGAVDGDFGGVAAAIDAEPGCDCAMLEMREAAAGDRWPMSALPGGIGRSGDGGV